MKKLLLSTFTALGLGVTMLGVTSCDSEQGLTIAFNQDIEQIVTILPNSTLRIDTTSILTSNLDSMLAANNASRDDVQEITLASLEMGLCDSLGNDDFNQNFDAWDSVGVRVFVPNDLSVPNVLVASASVPRNLWGFSVALTQQDFDFVPYIGKQEFAIRLLNKLNTPITTKKYVKVKVRVNIVGEI